MYSINLDELNSFNVTLTESILGSRVNAKSVSVSYKSFNLPNNQQSATHLLKDKDKDKSVSTQITWYCGGISKTQGMDEILG